MLTAISYWKAGSLQDGADESKVSPIGFLLTPRSPYLAEWELYRYQKNDVTQAKHSLISQPKRFIKKKKKQNASICFFFSSCLMITPSLFRASILEKTTDQFIFNG